MRSIGKILARYLASAAGIVLLLFIINTSVLLGWVVQSSRAPQLEYRIRDIAAGLRAQDGGYALDAESQEALASRYAWAMLLDDRGDAVWSWQLPEDVPVHYTVPEVGVLYPLVFKRLSGLCLAASWRGLLVLGSSKDGVWKGSLELPMQAARQAPAWLIAALVLNIGAAIGLAVLLSFRLFRSLRQLAGGIEGLADKAAAEVPVQQARWESLRRTSTAPPRSSGARTRPLKSAMRPVPDGSRAYPTISARRSPWSWAMRESWRRIGRFRERARAERRSDPRTERAHSGARSGFESGVQAGVRHAAGRDMQPLCLAELPREIAAEVVNAQTHARYTVRLDIQQGGQGATVAADARLLGRALHNLVGNSIRHNPEGCSVTIRLARWRRALGNPSGGRRARLSTGGMRGETHPRHGAFPGRADPSGSRRRGPL